MLFSVLLSFLLYWNSLDNQREAFLNEVNKIRAEGCDCGGEYFKPVLPVRWDDTLEKVAYGHSKDMAVNKYFAHIGKKGDSPADRLKQHKYFYRSFAENIFQAIGYKPTPYEVIEAWKNSPTHCKNLMNDTVDEMGIGVYEGFYTQLFGKKLN